MTDMTAEQAILAELRRALGHDGEVYQNVAKMLRQALTAPRVPDGWLVMRGKYGIIVQGPEGMITEQVRSSKENLCFHDPVIYQFLESLLTAAPAPADSFAKNYDVTGDGVAVLKPEAARRMIGLDKPMPLFETAQGGELTKLRERVRELEQSLEAARGWLQAGLSAINMSGQRGGSDE